MPVLLLTTTGRRSGTARTTPLTFLRDGSDLVVVASNGGADRAPAWSLNLQHNPRATVQIDAHALRITARQASAGERKRLWPVITAAYSGYARYQKRTTRHIPVVLLTPLVPPGGLSGGGEVPCHALRGERLPRCRRRGARCRGDQRHDQCCGANGGERYEHRAPVRLLGQESGKLDREPCLARAAGTDDREHARLAVEPQGGRLEELARARGSESPE